MIAGVAGATTSVPLSGTLEPALTPMTELPFTQFVNEAQNRVQAGVSPGQLGESILDGLSGYFHRASSLADRASTPIGPLAVTGPGPVTGQVDHAQINHVIQSLSTMFNYSIETQMVVRGGTQVSGAANTLLRGQ